MVINSTLFLPHLYITTYVKYTGKNVITTSYNIVSISHKSAYRVLGIQRGTPTPKYAYYTTLVESGLIGKMTREKLYKIFCLLFKKKTFGLMTSIFW